MKLFVQHHDCALLTRLRSIQNHAIRLYLPSCHKPHYDNSKDYIFTTCHLQKQSLCCVAVKVMKAVVITTPGDPEVLQLQDVEDPVIMDDEILIKVAAAALNRADTFHRNGLYEIPSGDAPYLGMECSGTILALGNNVTRWKIGDQVHGGSSGIGTFAIQMAKCQGARVFCTAGTEEKLAACQDLGADVVINYKTEDIVARIKEETGGKGVDVILDHIGASYLQRNLDSLNLDGRLFLISIMGGAIGEINLNSLLTRRLTVQAARLRFRSPEKKAEIIREVEKNVWPVVGAGKVKPVVYKCFPLSEAAAAHRLMGSRNHIGKILLRP